MRRENKNGLLLWAYQSSSEENVTDAEVSGYRFQPQRQRHVLEHTREAELTKRQTSRDAVDWCRTDLTLCLCGDRSLSAVMKWLQLGNTRSMLMKVNIKLTIIVIA